MDKVWLKSYPPGVPASIDMSEYRSVAQLFESCAEEYGDRPAYENMGSTLTYRDIDRLSAAFGAYLQQALGLRKGDRVALMMPNLLQYPIALFGVLRAGMTVVNTNPLYTKRELQHQLSDSGARAIVILENFAHVLEQVVYDTPVEHAIVTSIGDMHGFPRSALINFAVRHVKKMVPRWEMEESIAFNDVIRVGKKVDLAPVDLTHDDLAFLQYTGGTTGVAKGAMLTHGNMVANMLQATAWIRAFTDENTREVIITALPLYHIFALTANCLTYMNLGGFNRLITNPRDMPGFVKELKKAPFTAITGVNTLFNALLNTPGFEQVDFSGLKVTLGGGMAVQRRVAERWKEVTGCTLVEAYGLTETAPAACINPLNLAEYNGSIGLPIPSTECCVKDEAGKVLDVGEVGELCVRGPQVMKGYFNRPQETDRTIDEDGWLHTGDIAKMDAEGYFYIVDRKKDMILVSGFNVYPNEIEDVVAAHPGVQEVGAVGEPDQRSGEVVKIVVVRKDPSLTDEQLIAYCREQLTGYKVPKIVEFRDELPKTNVGKILRRKLRSKPLSEAK